MPIDYGKYPPNWKSEIRPRILARSAAKANSRRPHCEFCGARNHAVGYRDSSGKFIEALIKHVNSCGNPPTMRIVLTIAHLDHDPENWQVQDDRLAALRQYCHLKYDAPRKAKERQAKRDAAKSLGLFNTNP